MAGSNPVRARYLSSWLCIYIHIHLNQFGMTSTCKYSLKVLLFLKVLEYRYEYKYFLKVRVLSTAEYCKIGTRVLKYRSTEYFGPKPDTLFQSVQRHRVYSAAYGTVHYKKPLRSLE